MTEYLVRWEIDLSAASPEDAARQAQDSMTAPDSTARVFTVIDYSPTRRTVTVDLSPVTRYYVSADDDTDDGPWSVYSETYADRYTEGEPIDGSQERLVTAPNKSTAAMIATALNETIDNR